VACPDRIPLSAKVSFPPLAGEAPTSDLHRKGYELVQVHFDKLQDENIRERARHGIEALFHAVSRELDRQCSEMITATVNIRAIALSIPAHWTLDYEDEYRKIVQKAFSNFHGDIFFLTEAEALAHYLYRDHRAVLVPDPDDEHGNVVLIMDFGGHNMVCSSCLPDNNNTQSWDYQSAELR
jgi:hypothetical protein